MCSNVNAGTRSEGREKKWSDLVLYFLVHGLIDMLHRERRQIWHRVICLLLIYCYSKQGTKVGED